MNLLDRIKLRSAINLIISIIERIANIILKFAPKQTDTKPRRKILPWRNK